MSNRPGRPREFEDLVQVTIKVPSHLVKQARRLNINASEICRQAFSAAVNDPIAVKFHEEKDEAIEKFKGIPKDEIDNMIDTMRKHPDYLPKVLAWCNEKYNKKITREDLEKMIPKY